MCFLLFHSQVCKCVSHCFIHRSIRVFLIVSLTSIWNSFWCKFVIDNEITYVLFLLVLYIKKYAEILGGYLHEIQVFFYSNRSFLH